MNEDCRALLRDCLTELRFAIDRTARFDPWPRAEDLVDRVADFLGRDDDRPVAPAVPQHEARDKPHEDDHGPDR